MGEPENNRGAFHLLAPTPAGGAGSSANTAVHLKEGHVAACRALQASRCLSLMGQHGLEFSMGLLMLRLYPSSILLVSLSGLLESLVLVVFGSTAGSHLDSHPRLEAARDMHLLQNSMGALSMASMLALLRSSGTEGLGRWEMGGLALSVVAGSVNRLAAFGLVCVERDWAKVLSGEDSSSLAALNSTMKCIDLTCLIISPIIIGLIMEHSAAIAALVLMTWCLISWLPEVQLLAYAQQHSPALASKQPSLQHGSVEAARSDDISRDVDSVCAGWSMGCRWCGGGLQSMAPWLCRHTHAWAVYARQPAAAAALALALLYLTVCSWGPLMIAYLKGLGLPEAHLALFHGLGPVMGILASLAFRLLCRCPGLVPTGAVSVWLQLACLLGGVLPSVAAALGLAVAPRLRVETLLWGLTLSRYGLWTFDLSVNQIIQETNEPASLGTVNGVQGALQSLFQMLAFLAGALGPSAHQFVWLMAASCGVVATAAVLFTVYAFRASCYCSQPGRHADV